MCKYTNKYLNNLQTYNYFEILVWDSRAPKIHYPPNEKTKKTNGWQVRCGSCNHHMINFVLLHFEYEFIPLPNKSKVCVHKYLYT